MEKVTHSFPDYFFCSHGGGERHESVVWITVSLSLPSYIIFVIYRVHNMPDACIIPFDISQFLLVHPPR